MPKNDITLSEIKELLGQVDYLVLEIDRMGRFVPDVAKVARTFIQVIGELEKNIDSGSKRLNDAVNGIDLDILQKQLARAIGGEMRVVAASVTQMEKQTRQLGILLEKNREISRDTNRFLNTADDKLEELEGLVERIKPINKAILTSIGAGAFVAGLIAMYLASFVTWIPKPYFVSNDQALMFEMVKNNNLKLDQDIAGNLRISIVREPAQEGDKK
jgi:methyl-accepting chemotaxis protein